MVADRTLTGNGVAVFPIDYHWSTNTLLILAASPDVLGISTTERTWREVAPQTCKADLQITVSPATGCVMKSPERP